MKAHAVLGTGTSSKPALCDVYYSRDLTMVTPAYL